MAYGQRAASLLDFLEFMTSYNTAVHWVNLLSKSENRLINHNKEKMSSLRPDVAFECNSALRNTGLGTASRRPVRERKKTRIVYN